MCFTIEGSCEPKVAKKNIVCWKILYPGCISVIQDFNYRPNRLYKIKGEWRQLSNIRIYQLLK